MNDTACVLVDGLGKHGWALPLQVGLDFATDGIGKQHRVAVDMTVVTPLLDVLKGAAFDICVLHIGKCDNQSH